MKKYRCSCSKSAKFSTKGELKDHIRTSHKSDHQARQEADEAWFVKDGGDTSAYWAKNAHIR